MPASGLQTPRLLLLPLTVELAAWALSAPVRDAAGRLTRADDWPDDSAASVLGLAEFGPVEAQWLVAVRSLPEPVVVGGCGVRAVHPRGEWEIGYGLAPSARGRGFATEAVGALVEHLFAQPAVAAVVAEAENLPSRQLLERLGFEAGDDLFRLVRS